MDLKRACKYDIDWTRVDWLRDSLAPMLEHYELLLATPDRQIRATRLLGEYRYREKFWGGSCGLSPVAKRLLRRAAK